MVSREEPEEGVRKEYQELSHWLLNSAYPLWASRGFDTVRGGFHELLDRDGPPMHAPRRIRVQVRQVYCFARAPSLGWTEDTSELVDRGLAYVRAHYRRPDGLFRTLVTADGMPLDDRAFLYDQAFVLLAFAESQRVLGRQPALVAEAAQLREILYTRLKRSNLGFDSGVPDAVPLLANPHMHLLEAALAWTAISDDPAWQELADEIVSLALDRLIAVGTGALQEQFNSDWSPLVGGPDPSVEPGHQFEWAWLLLRWSRAAPGAARRHAERLIEIGETYGVHRGVAVNALLDDLTLSDGAARLWPQTERVKAAVSLAKLTGTAREWATASSAIAGFMRFLDPRRPGLWHDRLTADGRFVLEPSQASSFYHIVCGITELGTA